MKKCLRKSLCRGKDSVATIHSNNFRLRLAVPPFLPLRQRHLAEPSDQTVDDFSATSPSLISSYNSTTMMSSEGYDLTSSPPTLEEMLARLEEEQQQEEAVAQLADLMALSNFGSINPRRMSSVNNSDVLRAAKTALNIQYPRFSVDGRDLQQRPRSSLDIARRTPDLADDLKRKFQTTTMNKENMKKLDNQFSPGFREPCLLERLMGLETMPVAVHTPPHKSFYGQPKYGNILSNEKKIDQRRFMVQQPKPCRTINLEKQLSTKCFGSEVQKSAIKQPLGVLLQISESPKLHASSSKSSETILMKKKPNSYTNVKDEKDSNKSNCRMCSNIVH